MHMHLAIVEDIIDHYIHQAQAVVPNRQPGLGAEMLFFCSSLRAQFSFPDPLPHQIQHTVFRITPVQLESSSPPLSIRGLFYAPVFRLLQVVGHRESWMSAQHPPSPPSPHFRHPSSAIFFPLSSVLHRYIRGRGHWYLGIGHWLKRLENWDIGDGFAVSAWTRAQECLR